MSVGEDGGGKIGGNRFNLLGIPLSTQETHWFNQQQGLKNVYKMKHPTPEPEKQYLK